MRTILIPVDFSDVTEPLLEYAAGFATLVSGTIHLLHIAAPEPTFVGYEPGPPVVREQVALELRNEHRVLHEFAERLRGRGIETHALVIQGSTIESIVERAKKVGADLIMVGSHGHGRLYRALLGSVCEGIVRHAPCPVLIVPAPGRG